MIMTETLATEPLRLAREQLSALTLTHFIGGKFHEQGSGEFWDVLNPSNGETLGRAQMAGASIVDEAVSCAAQAQSTWGKRTAAQRAEVLLEMAAKIDENSELFAQIEALNVGKPIAVAREEIVVAADALRFFAGACRTAQAPAAGEYVDGHLSVVRREPIGVVGAVTPWNYPLMMAVWKIAPALAAGNTIVLKPSEFTPISTVLFAHLMQEVVPPGVVNIVLGTGQVAGEALTRHPGIGMISLTGSVASGQAVANGAATNLKRVHLELGGKAPVIVFPDADLDEVAQTLRVAGLWNTGQECGAATRILCHVDAHDALVAKVVHEFAEVSVGDPAESDQCEIGPLINERQRDAVSAMVDAATADGASVAVGGHVIDRPGYYYAPTVITGAQRGSAIVTQEIFGPVVTVETFETESEAIELANEVAYGLASSVWTEDLGRSLRVSDALDFGTVWVNSHLTIVSEMPWGGFGMSGYGRDMSSYALDDYTRTKHVTFAYRERD